MVCIACVACSESSESIDTIAGKAVFRLETAVPDARTELTTAEDGRYKAIWKAGDSYAVVQVADESVALSTGTVDEDAPSISAIAMFDQVAASSYRYIFASPTVVASADGSSVELSMADSQVPATMDTFDGSTDLILSDVVERTSQPNGVSVPFNAQRISAIGKMTIKNLPLAEGETATSVTFATTKPIAGKLSIMVSDIAAGTPLQNSAVSEPSAAVTVTLPQAQSGDFTAYFSCLPTILSAGEEYSVTVNTTNSSYTKQGQVPSDMSFTSGRMTSFAVNMSGTGSMIPSDLNRVIFYTSTDGNVVTPDTVDTFNANIVSNTNVDGQGIIVFDGEVTTIGNSAFLDCGNLASIILPNSVVSIGGYAFTYCSALTSITIPESVTSLGTNPFVACPQLAEFNGKYASADKRCLVVDGALISFAPAGLTEYTIPNGVTAIGDHAFQNCINITSVTIPESVTSLGVNAFFGCESLKSVYCKPTTIPAGGNNMFYGNAADRKIYVPVASVEAYKSAAEWSAYADAIVAEGGEVSANCKILYTSTDGNVITPYKTDAFGANIVSNTYENGQGVITFDGEVTTIGANAFWTRVTLASITLPQSVNYIGYYAFQGCNSLRSITIPDSVTNIDTNPFLDCKALEEFNGKFASEDKRCLIVNGVLNTFAIGSGVTEYNIPSDVNIVGSSSFAGCTTLTAVTIPGSTTVIRAAAFSNCSNLASVYCRPTTTPTGAERMFYGNAADRKIYVPSTAVDAYKSAQHWSDYADAIVAEEGKSSEPFMEGNSRLYVGDQIHIFNKINHSDTYTYNGEIDANGRPILELTTPTYYTNHTEIDKVIAVYCPEGTPILTIDENGSATTVKAIVRSKQKYHKDSYAIGSAPMVSVSDDISSIQLKNICGWVKLSITGNGEILKKIEFTGNKNEELATSSMISSSATISLSDLSVTSVGYAFTKLTMDFDNADEDENWDTATLSTTPTDFYFTMLPVALTDGFTVKIFCTDGTVMTKNFVVSTKVTRNSTITTEQFEYIGEQVKLNVSDLNTPVFRDLTYSEGYANTFEVKVANNSYQNGYFIFYNPDYVPSGAGDAGTLNGEYEIVSGNIGAKPGKKALIADPSRCFIPYDGDMYYFKSGKVTVSGTNESTTMVFDAIVTNSEGSDVPLQSQCTLASMGYTTSTSGTFTDIFGMASNVEFRYKQSGNQLAIQGGTESGNLMTLYLKATSFNNILGKEFTTSSTTDAILSGNLYFTGDTGSNYPYVDGGIKIEGNALSSKLYPNNLKFIDEEGSIYNIIAPDAGYYSIKLGNGTIYETGFNW